MIHVVTLETKRDEGKLVVHCPICQYCTEIETATGIKRTIHAGDPAAMHRGGSFGMGAAVEQGGAGRSRTRVH